MEAVEMKAYLIAILTISRFSDPGLDGLRQLSQSKSLPEDDRKLYVEIPSPNAQRPTLYICKPTGDYIPLKCTKMESTSDTRVAVYSTANFYIATNLMVANMVAVNPVPLDGANKVPSTPVMVGVPAENPLKCVFYGVAKKIDVFRNDVKQLAPEFLDEEDRLDMETYYSINDKRIFIMFYVARKMYFTYTSTLRRVVSKYKPQGATGGNPFPKMQMLWSFSFQSHGMGSIPQASKAAMSPHNPKASLLPKATAMTEATAFLLKKMIDPCSDMTFPSDFPVDMKDVSYQSPDEFCSNFCRFIDVTARLSPHKDMVCLCASSGGTCVKKVCTCEKTTTIPSCPPIHEGKGTFRMFVCQNALRDK